MAQWNDDGDGNIYGSRSFSVRRDDGRWVTITSKFLSTIAKISVHTAANRIKRFMDGHITVAEMLSPVSMQKGIRPGRVFQRDGASLQCFDLLEQHPDMAYVTAYGRLGTWEKGASDCDELFCPVRDMNASLDGMAARWDNMQVGPRMAIEDIPISQFERELGEKIERRHEEARNGRSLGIKNGVLGKTKRRSAQGADKERR